MSTVTIAGPARQGAHVVEMQRRRLLLAMVEVLSEHGLEDAQVGRVCKRAAVSRRTFYDVFVDREACLLAAFEFAIEQVTEKIMASFDPHAGWRERIRMGLTTLLECFDQGPGLARLCVIETLKGDQQVLERRGQAVNALIAAVDQGRSEAESTEPPPLTAESTVGGAIAVIHTRLLEHAPRPLASLVNPLMSMIAHPYLGPAAARKELERPVAPHVMKVASKEAVPADPFKDLPIRITFRTARVLDTIRSQPGASNREVSETAGVSDQGQMSKLLRRLENAGLIGNNGEGQAKGEANAWHLTQRGHGILHAVNGDTVG